MSAGTQSNLTREEALEEIEALKKTVEQLKRDIQRVEKERAEDRKRMDRLERELGQEKAKTPDSKVGLAMQISRDEAVRVSRKGLKGGSIDWPEVKGIADRQHGVDLNSGTVYDAWDNLEQEWDAFHVRDGEDGPNTKNKQLACDRDAITPALEHAVASGGN